jgi:hypothetical protein
MLIINLVKQEWKKSYRAQGFYKNLAVTLMLGFFALYMAVIFLFLGFSLNEILENANHKLNPMELFNGAMLYILLAGLAIRFFMQQLNTFNLPPYQVLPIKRSAIINFLILKPLSSPVNYFLLLIVIPFAVKSVVGYYSVSVAFRFILSFVFLIWFNSLTASFLKRKYGSGLLTFLWVIIILGGVAALEYFKVFSLFKISGLLFGFVVMKSYGLIFPLLFVGIAYLLNKWFFSQNYYPEKFNSKIQAGQTVTSEMSFLNRFGIIGNLIGLELKLILRHKRTKSMLYMSAFFLFYGLFFYTQKVYANNNGMLFFVAMFVTGLLMIMFGQWVISWDSGHFDSLMTKNIPIRTYFSANYYLMIAFNVICFILTTPYFFFGEKIVYMHLAAFIFNIGVNIYLLLFLATYNTKRVDLSKSSAMNYQGTTYKSFLIVVPIMILPMIIVGTLSAFFSLKVALWTLTLLGITGIVFRNFLITLCVNQFNRRKYKLTEGFRESE